MQIYLKQSFELKLNKQDEDRQTWMSRKPWKGWVEILFEKRNYWDTMKMLEECRKIHHGRLTACYPAHLLAWLHKLNPVGQVRRRECFTGRYIRVYS